MIKIGFERGGACRTLQNIERQMSLFCNNNILFFYPSIHLFIPLFIHYCKDMFIIIIINKYQNFIALILKKCSEALNSNTKHNIRTFHINDIRIIQLMPCHIIELLLYSNRDVL